MDFSSSEVKLFCLCELTITSFVEVSVLTNNREVVFCCRMILILMLGHCAWRLVSILVSSWALVLPILLRTLLVGHASVLILNLTIDML